MIRKIILMLLIFGVVVQGASAEIWMVSSDMAGGLFNGTMGVTDLDTVTIPIEYINTPGYVYMIAGGTCISGCFYDEASQLAEIVLTGVVTNTAPTSSKAVNLRTPSTGKISFNNAITINSGGSLSVLTSRVIRSATAGLHVEMSRSGSTVIVSTESPNIAQGASCDGLGSYDIYMNGSFVYTDADDGNYSFSIFDGVEYNIEYKKGNISEWHNFTASENDDWSPICTECNPDLGVLTGPTANPGFMALDMTGNGMFKVYQGGELWFNSPNFVSATISPLLDGVPMQVFFSNSTIAGAWWNFTIDSTFDAIWYIEGCGGGQSNITGTLTDEYGDGMFGIQLAIYEGTNLSGGPITDSSGNFNAATLLPSTNYNVFVHGFGADSADHFIGVFNTDVDGFNWDIEQYTGLNPTVEVNVRVDGNYTTPYSVLIIDHEGPSSNVSTRRDITSAAFGKYTYPVTINWNDATFRVTALDYTEDFDYSFSNLRDTASGQECTDDRCIIDIQINTTIPAPPIWGEEPNLTKDFNLDGYLRGLDRGTGFWAIPNQHVTIDCTGGSYGTSTFVSTTGRFNVDINESQCQNIIYSAPEYESKTFYNVNWTDWMFEYVYLERLNTSCTIPTLHNTMNPSRVGQTVEFSSCMPLSSQSYPSYHTVLITTQDGVILYNSGVVIGFAAHTYQFLTEGFFDIIIENTNKLIEQHVLGSDGDLNSMEVSPLVVNKFLGYFDIIYYSNSSFNHINVSQNGTSILSFNTDYRVLTTQRINKDAFTSFSSGDVIDIYFMHENQTIITKFITLSGGTVDQPCGLPNCKEIATSTSSSYQDLSYSNMVDKLFGNKLLISIIMLLMIMLCINRYYISVAGIWLVYAYEVNMIPNIVFFTIVTILILVFAYKITNVGGNSE